MSPIQQAMELLRAGRPADAELLARQVLQTQPDNPDALHCLGLIAQRTGRHGDAAALIRRAIGSSPTDAQLAYNHSISLSALGDLPAAESALREAIRLRPDLAEAHTNLGATLTRLGNLPGALESFREVTRLRPADPLARLNLGKTFRSLDQLDEAESSFREAIHLAPTLAPAWNMLGSCLREAGRIDEAIACFENAIQIDPAFREAHSNLCYALYFDPSTTGQRIVDVHREWARKFAAVPTPALHIADRSPPRRLRVGYVSPSFRAHAVGSFVVPIFEHHDRGQFEIIAYSDTANPDQVTERLRQCATIWRDTRGLSDQALADLVRADRVDILVDLTLHMRGCRLAAFAHRPAPVQLTHLAYCGTSGLQQMDGCITDTHMEVDGVEQAFTEPLLPLPETYWAYRPPAHTPPVSPPPVLQNGYITFGCLNSLAKVNDRVLTTWSHILAAIPDSRLALFLPGFESNPSLLRRLQGHGIPAGRVDPYPRQPLHSYFETYNRIDLALDPFPYNGGTTSLDALWMGVPVVTLAGTLPVGRAGVSILSNVGLEVLITRSEDEYINRAVEICTDVSKLQTLRAGLRSRMVASPLLDERAYVRDLEVLYLRAWQRFLTWA